MHVLFFRNAKRSPDGRKFRSRNELRQYLDKNGLDHNPEDFDFSIWGRGGRHGNKNPVSVPPPPPPVPEGKTPNPEKLATRSQLSLSPSLSLSLSLFPRSLLELSSLRRSDSDGFYPDLDLGSHGTALGIGPAESRGLFPAHLESGDAPDLGVVGPAAPAGDASVSDALAAGSAPASRSMTLSLSSQASNLHLALASLFARLLFHCIVLASLVHSQIRLRLSSDLSPAS